MLISFICATNDFKLYESCLGRSLRYQTDSDYEVIKIDTVGRAYVSAADALNDAATTAQGVYLVFVHQDIVLPESFVAEFRRWSREKDFIIAGVAGACSGKSVLHRTHISNIVHGPDKRRLRWSVQIDKPVNCETVDECLFAIPRRVFMKRPLSASLSSWHLYAVEFCLWARLQSASTVCVLPISIWHLSTGASFNSGYYKSLDMLVERYGALYCVITTTMGRWPTQRHLYLIRKKVDQLKRLIRGH